MRSIVSVRAHWRRRRRSASCTNRYPVATLQEGIVTGHPAMPEFQLDPGQVNDVITYLKSLEN
jgi:hypothetical protein